MFCQLETLRYCLPPSVRHTLDELSETLDETYERILKEIKKPNRVHALRLMQCLVVATRPLLVQELAEVLAVDFGNQEGLPKLNPNWRWGDEEQALLSSCSSLITIVEAKVSRIVQFSHFSVREFLTSARLATSSKDISPYHIELGPAHTILAQACLSVLLRLDGRVEERRGGAVENSSPLARYAAEHWVAHAQHGNVSSCIRKATEYLFDADKPYFAAWVRLHDLDSKTSYLCGSMFRTLIPYYLPKSHATPLYYAARCGFQDLVEHIVANDPTQVNATGGYYLTPLVVALAAGHFQTANFLYDNGAHPNVEGYAKGTPLQSAASCGEFEMVQVLLKYKADVHAPDSDGKTPLYFALQCRDYRCSDKAFDIVRLFLEYGADINAQDNNHSTPLHSLVRYGTVTDIRMLLELGADVNARQNDGTTPLHHMAYTNTRVEHMRVLLEHGADVYARTNDGTTPLHLAISMSGAVEPICALLEHGADINARKTDGTTPLHLASELGAVERMRVLLEHGTDVNAQQNHGITSLHLAAYYGRVEGIRVLLEHGADVNARTNLGSVTPLHFAAENGTVEGTRVLLEHGADVAAEDDDGDIEMMSAQNDEVRKLLLEYGAIL